jgi:hypothetical protein
MSLVTPQADRTDAEIREQIQSVYKGRWFVIRRQVKDYLADGRGRASWLADQLGVSRQTVHRWFVAPQADKVPAWAAIAVWSWWLSRGRLAGPSGASVAFMDGVFREADSQKYSKGGVA